MSKKSKKEKKSKKDKKDKKDKEDKEDKKQKKESKIEGRPQTAVEAMTSFFKDEPASRGDYYLAQKSERLLYEVGGAAADDGADAEGAGGTFVWRQKDKRSGLDRLEPEQVLLVNRLKREETERELEKLRRRKVEREREREEMERERVGWGLWVCVGGKHWKAKNNHFRFSLLVFFSFYNRLFKIE